RPGLGATGRLTATLRGNTLRWRLTFAHLSTPPVAVVLHTGKPGKVGPRVAQIRGRGASPATGFVILTQSQIMSLLLDGMYVNLGTEKYPHGEIRGQLRFQTDSATVSPGASSAGGGGAGGGHLSHSSHSSHVSHSSHSSHFSSS